MALAYAKNRTAVETLMARFERSDCQPGDYFFLGGSWSKNTFQKTQSSTREHSETVYSAIAPPANTRLATANSCCAA